MEYDSITVEKDGDDWQVFGWGEYGRGSVLAGQTMKCRLQFYPTLEQALEAYPNAEVMDYPTGKPENKVSDVPPDWYDYLNAGEEW